jgi:hypothetical protein
MKKTIYSILALAAFAFSSCTNTNSVNPRPTEQTISKVTLSGRLRAELNNTVTGLENAPDGLKIVVAISTSNFVVSQANTSYVTKYYEATSSAGTYTVEVEVGPYGNNAVVNFPGFRADVIVNNTTNVSTLFSPATRTVSLVKGQSAFADYNY